MTEYHSWGEKQMPTEEDINRQFQKRPESMFKEEKYSELEHLWKEITAIGNPLEYAEINRTVQNGETTTVDIDYPNERYEVYEIDGQSITISIMDEENHQHGFETLYKPMHELGDWLQDIINQEDDLTWVKHQLNEEKP